jgi:glycosyltransferase involved in cell wall biosynthesis
MARKYRLLMTISEFMYSSQVRNLCDIVSGLDRDCFDIEIGALAVGDEATEEIDALGVPYYLLATLPPRRLNLRYLKNFVSSPFFLHRKNFDLVHSLLYQSLFIEPLIMKSFSNTKYVFTKSNIQWDNHPVNWYLKSRLADSIISISQLTSDLLIERGFKNKVRKIFLGINPEHFQESEKKRREMRARLGISPQTLVFGCAAQFIRMKNHGVLVRAFELLCERHADSRLFFCGPHHGDEYYQEVLLRIERSPVRDKIQLLGTLSDMPAFYSAIDCFVLPSDNEPFGFVFIEAMSCNKPVIACRNGGPLDIIEEGRCGFLVEVDDPSDLAKKMDKYARDRNLIVEHGNACRKRARELFSTEVMVKKHQDLYLDLLE